jgi:hypothetical protein
MNRRLALSTLVSLFSCVLYGGALAEPYLPAIQKGNIAPRAT